jgi:hypothetical protein
MSFVLVLVLIAVVAVGLFRLIRRDADAPPRAESHRPPEG